MNMQLNKYKFDQVIFLFLLALCLAALGLQCRSYQALSLFWPCNALLLGLLIRFPRFDTLSSLPAIYFGMVCADVLFGTPFNVSLGLDAANIAFIVTGRAVLLSPLLTRPYPRRLQALIRVFPASIIGAAVCAAVGSFASQRYFHDDLLKGWISWFCEQVSTSILLLPLVITLLRKDELAQFMTDLRESSLMPLLSLLFSTVAGIYVGGGGSLIFPLPALMWCAVSYPIFFTCLLTLFTGIAEITLVASNVLNIQGSDDFFRIDSLASARLGVAAMTISPLIVALSTTANKKLVARITQRADYDFLTGALTRSGLSSRLATLATRRNKQNSFYGAAFVIDIDRFKSINDTYGHAAGDIVLAKTVECIRQSLQQTAIISRMGGEEFLVLIEGISQPRAYLLADRLRQSIERNAIVLNTINLNVTVSIGISTLNITDPSSLDESIKHADEQLYIAKSSGRNRVSPEFVL
ncbi:diguanylate cyclase [Erwinia sp. MMLR14_017]|uniref:GGDEF domain-containing protein n=1 Tax=Erwinia sp. MMLR14_017 TaxID=3093842 RepID=UPI00298FBBAA|nr:diguanylate cyclase [Erwinia sp. MMLR14_017]MDW8846730.1 diguanylate cyclase [Erwinia sp. MMLR14_017]